MALFERVKNDPRVEYVAYGGPDYENGEGWWVRLRDGYNWNGVVTIHERTLPLALKALGEVEASPKP